MTVKYHGRMALKFASNKLQNDKDFLVKAVTKNQDAFKFVPPMEFKDVVASSFVYSYLFKHKFQVLLHPGGAHG